ncbi:MAG: hypothetical protein AAB551_01720 [Patescibacteria group bacterium]
MKEEQLWNTVVFYCKDCERIVDVDRAGRKYVYMCKICHTKNVAFGTEKSIRGYFHVEDEPVTEEPVTSDV